MSHDVSLILILYQHNSIERNHNVTNSPPVLAKRRRFDSKSASSVLTRNYLLSRIVEQQPDNNYRSACLRIRDYASMHVELSAVTRMNVTHLAKLYKPFLFDC